MIRRQKDYPKHLEIGENLWEIKFCRVVPGMSESIVGGCETSEHVIYIKMGQTPVERFKTFAHEICHAVCYEYDIPENHAIIHELEEPIVRFLLDNGLVL